ncbi:MAG: hypothetical protein JO153_18050 [Solirubrobacterales bacterium]|nr:hypothetical protein [Solirubrobacterales bacterium]
MRTELHFHLLPDVDDGPRDDREAIELASLAVADGTRRVVATPHVSQTDLRTLAGRVQALRRVLAEAGVALHVAAGGELSPTDVAGLAQRELELVAQGPPDTRWLLLEAPLYHDPLGLRAAAEELRARGFGVLIAHPERSDGLTLEELGRHAERSSPVQINATSLAGLHGPGAARLALTIAGSGLPFVVASDAHSPERPPMLSQAAASLAAAGVDPVLIRAAVDTGPAELFERGRLTFGSTQLQFASPARRRAA